MRSRSVGTAFAQVSIQAVLERIEAPWGVRGPVDFWALRRLASARLVEGSCWLSCGIANSCFAKFDRRLQ